MILLVFVETEEDNSMVDLRFSETGVVPQFMHVGVWVDYNKLLPYKGEAKIVDMVDLTKYRKKHNCLIYELPIPTEEAIEKRMNLGFLRELDNDEYVEYWTTGRSPIAERFEGLSCSQFAGYILGYEDYYKLDVDTLHSRIAKRYIPYR